ncbi:DNA primase [Mycobacterium phage Wooldri]|nr:DNA primase [Mycobacterium phage Wooldri]
MADEPLIVKVIHRYHPEWEPPRQGRSDWMKTRCPFHGDETPSASISFKHNAFRCFACPVKGSAVAIIKEQEEVSYAEAKRIAEELSPGGDGTIPAQPSRQSRRRVFGDKGSGVSQHQGRPGQVHARVRGRSTPWS